MLRDTFSNQSIRIKILVCFFCIIGVSFTAISVLYYEVFSAAMETMANESTQVVIGQVSGSVENQVHNTDNVMSILAANREVQRFFEPGDVFHGSKEMAMTRIAISNYLARFTETYGEILAIALITDQGYFLSNELYERDRGTINADEWYRQCVAEPDRLHLFVKPTSRSLLYYDAVSADSILSVARAVLDSEGAVTGVLLVDTDLAIIEQGLVDVSLPQEGFVCLLEEQGDVIYSPVNHIVPRLRPDWFREGGGVFNKTILGERYRMIYETSQLYGWKVIGVFSLQATLQEVENTRAYLVLILLGVGSITVVLAVLFSATITKPLIKLKELMFRAQQGDLTISFPVRYSDEIGQLGNAFNEMIYRIQSLITVVYKEQRAKRQAELQALQAQIKPHFLYNTFDTIHWLAKKYQAHDIIHLVQCLTSLFRIGLSKGSEMITMAEEVEHVRSYLDIQQVRYQDILCYDIQVEQEVQCLFVHKFLLQPLVENAIYHGLKENRKPGTIAISVLRQGEELILRVRDDGRGIGQERLVEMNRALQSREKWKSGYGLYNVHERIQLSFGSGYGVQIKSQEGRGTEVTIRYPVLREVESEGSVSGNSEV